MRDQCTGSDLLDTARALLRDELLALLPSEKRLTALMIANAMGIASRQWAVGDAPGRAELAALADLLGESMTTHAQGSVHDSLMDLNRRLSEHIRAGGADPGVPRRSEVFAHLRTVARQKVAESNPKYLESAS